MDNKNYIKQILKFSSLFVPLIILITTIITSFYVNQTFDNSRQDDFTESVNDIRTSIEGRTDKYLTVINSVQSAFMIQDQFDRADWENYFNINRFNELDGINTIIYIPAVKRENIAEFEEEINSDTSFIYKEGFQYKVLSESNSEIVYPVTYLSDYENLISVLGYDIGQEKERSEALKRAAISGEPSASSTVTFIVSNEKGMHLIIPLFKNERIPEEYEKEENIKGFISVTFRLEELFQTLVTSSPFAENQYIKVTDDTGLIYSNLPEEFNESSDVNLQYSFNLELGGRVWTITIITNDQYKVILSQQLIPFIILIGGISLSVLSLMILYYLIFSSNRAEDIANKLTKELQKNENRTNAILNNSSAIIYLKDLKNKYLFINDSFRNKLELNYKNIKNRIDLDLFPEEIAENLRKNENIILKSRLEQKFEEKLPTKEGIKLYSSVKFPLFNESEEIYAICSISTNIEDRNKFEEELVKRNEELEKLNKLMIDREIKMKELKDEIAKLKNTEGGD